MSLRNLGVILDSRWSFDEHIRQIVGRSNKILGFIKGITFKLDHLLLSFGLLILEINSLTLIQYLENY